MHAIATSSRPTPLARRLRVHQSGDCTVCIACVALYSLLRPFHATRSQLVATGSQPTSKLNPSCLAFFVWNRAIAWKCIVCIVCLELYSLYHSIEDLGRFRALQSSSLDEIRCRGVWYIVLGWQFYVHTAVSSESLTEAVGSYLAITRRHSINGKLSLKHLVWSSKLRAIGLTGFGGEEGVMALALNTYFECDGPEGWHFIAKRRKHNTLSTAELRREVRLLSTPK